MQVKIRLRRYIPAIWSLSFIALLSFCLAYAITSILSNRSPSYQKDSSIGQLLDTNNKTSIPLCLIATWENGKLPDYAKFMFESIARNAGYARLSVFYHNVLPNIPLQQQYSNIDFINLANLDARWEKGGFPLFASDRICEIFYAKYALLESLECLRLRASIKWSQYRGEHSSPIDQLRGMFGRLFAPYIPLAHCDAWAYTGLDIIFGNLRGWLANNALIWDMDVFTISGTDYDNVYTRGQFTGHNQLRIPDKVNNLWRRCENFQSLETIAHAFSHSWFGMDEGCYSRAVVTSNMKFGMFPWQGSTKDSRKLSYMILQPNGRLWTARSCHSMAKCRNIVKLVDAWLENSQEESAATLPQYSLANSKSNYKLDLGLSQQSKKGCMQWVQPRFKTCLADYVSIPYSVSNDQSNWAIILDDASGSRMIVWDKALLLDSRVEEVMFYHFSKSKAGLTSRKEEEAIIEIYEKP